MRQALSYQRGLQFETQEGRAAFFREAESNPRTVPYGAALSHARATNLGLWGDNDALYRDCVKIMVAELQRVEEGLGEPRKIREEEIAASRAFRRAYEIVRMPKEMAINNLVRSLGHNAENLLIEVLRVDQQTLDDLNDLHDRVIREVLQQREYQR